MVIVALAIMLWGISLHADTMVDGAYVPPLASDLIKHDQEQQQLQNLSSMQSVVNNAMGKQRSSKRLRKKGAAKTAPKNAMLNLMTLAAAQKASLDQEVFDLLKKQYDDELLTQKVVSLSIKKMAIKDVIRTISSSTGLAFIVDGDVSGSVHDIKMDKLPLPAALHSLLSSSNPPLALVKDLGVFRIMKQQAAKDLFRGVAAHEREKDFVSSTYVLNNVKWNNALKQRIEKLWQGVVQGCNEKQFFYLVLDEVQNKVLFKTRKAYAEEFVRQLKEFDVKVPEIRIDARVVLADKDFNESFGINWSGVYNRRGSLKRMDFAGLGATTKLDSEGKGNGISVADPKVAGSTTTPFNQIVGWALNFVPSTVTNSIKIPFVFGNKNLNTKRLNIELNAAETRKEMKTILKPSLLVHNDEMAEILVGEEMPQGIRLQESVAGGNLENVNTVRYKDIGVKVKVRPTVSPDQSEIFLDVFVENSSLIQLQAGATLGSATDGFNYKIQTSRSQNRVLLKSGQTTMISGLVTSIEERVKSGFPFLQDIPVLGWLFSYNSKELVDKQLLVFLTSTLVEG